MATQGERDGNQNRFDEYKAEYRKFMPVIEAEGAALAFESPDSKEGKKFIKTWKQLISDAKFFDKRLKRRGTSETTKNHAAAIFKLRLKSRIKTGRPKKRGDGLVTIGGGPVQWYIWYDQMNGVSRAA